MSEKDEIAVLSGAAAADRALFLQWCDHPLHHAGYGAIYERCSPEIAPSDALDCLNPTTPQPRDGSDGASDGFARLARIVTRRSAVHTSGRSANESCSIGASAAQPMTATQESTMTTTRTDPRELPELPEEKRGTVAQVVPAGERPS